MIQSWVIVWFLENYQIFMVIFLTGCENGFYDAKSLSKELKLALEQMQDRQEGVATCSISQVPIVIENYLGIASLLHNATELGFFKLRGKVSF